MGGGNALEREGGLEYEEVMEGFANPPWALYFRGAGLDQSVTSWDIRAKTRSGVHPEHGVPHAMDSGKRIP